MHESRENLESKWKLRENISYLAKLKIGVSDQPWYKD